MITSFAVGQDKLAARYRHSKMALTEIELMFEDHPELQKLIEQVKAYIETQVPGRTE